MLPSARPRSTRPRRQSQPHPRQQVERRHPDADDHRGGGDGADVPCADLHPCRRPEPSHRQAQPRGREACDGAGVRDAYPGAGVAPRSVHQGATLRRVLARRRPRAARSLQQPALLSPRQRLPQAKPRQFRQECAARGLATVRAARPRRAASMLQLQLPDDFPSAGSGAASSAGATSASATGSGVASSAATTPALPSLIHRQQVRQHRPRQRLRFFGVAARAPVAGGGRRSMR